MSVGIAEGKRNLVPTKGDFQPSVEDKANDGSKKPQPSFFDDIDAIACGVEAWFEENTGYSRRVTEMTVDIARALGVPGVEIKRWVACRLIRDMEKGRVIKSLLERLQSGLICVDSREPLRGMIRNEPSADPGVSRRGK